MVDSKKQPLKIDTRRYYVLAPDPPFIEIFLQSSVIRAPDFSKIVEAVGRYQNDPRLIEMVRKGGDASAKIPYLMERNETDASILDILRGIARPHVEWIQNQPAAFRATIHLLLSLNKFPKGCEVYAIPALIEIDRIQGEIVNTLQDLMQGRQLAIEFKETNLAALRLLDQDWPHLRGETSLRWPTKPLPETTAMQYEPIFDKADRMIDLREKCVIVDPPELDRLQALTPAVLRRPLPSHIPAPATGSADWLLREVGKIGRQFTRALVEIIKTHLAAERIALEARNYELITRQAHEALREFIEANP
jgi:hypothetical protein